MLPQQRTQVKLAIGSFSDFVLDTVFYVLLFAEAVEFRDWCVNEWVRLTGTSGTIINYQNCFALFLCLR